ncbi:sensor histidine kinase [Branchiibius sp. NY16-3462-2]|uniref:sensor histidine kinase n=1 Tax=Branchiibius sp. NY16-3462-2 TaxID=1807500 RepID=UPI0007922115|nr:sensor histidine kinase [Branchiibius sp. NY16-3462-2]KYH43725.1 hypothetical protein AZH51_02705 [Branchiibius sp. NY16-3462-2]
MQSHKNTATPADRRGVGVREDRFGRWVGLFWSCIWLFWLVPAYVQWWHHRDQPAAWLGAAAVLAFMVLHVVHFMCNSAAFGPDSPPIRTNTGNLLRYAGLVILAVVSCWTLGQAASATVAFVGIVAMWTFRVPVAIGVAILTGAIYVFASTHVSGWTYDRGTLVGLGFGCIAVGFGRLASQRQEALQRSRLENADLRVREERNRMARDLHDILGHSLTVITVKAELAGRLIDVDLDRAKAELADLERLSRTALGDVRRAVEGYREISLAGELARARESLTAAGIKPVLPNTVDEVPEDLREPFAWAVREAVTNVIRHSGASICRITVNSQAVVVSDDGRGMAASGSGNGLRGLQERAAAAGAVLITRAARPHGFELVMATPQAADHVPSTVMSEAS